ncbi:MAG: TRAP transporter permease [Candidatus Tectomicrobia bacterium]|nr:TRAP transporter permease [Candidatus Tectomicrobia bacterium]
MRTWSLRAASGVAVLLSLYHLYTTVFGTPPSYLHRSYHLLFVLVLVGLAGLGPKRTDWRSNLIGTWLYLVGSIASMAYLVFNYDYIVERFTYAEPLHWMDVLASVVVLAVVIDGTRRVVGWAMPVVALVSLAYAFFGHYLPRLVGHPPVLAEVVLEHQVLTPEGVFGIPLGVSATYIILFTLFGAFLYNSGVGSFFMDLAVASAGRYSGGPAKVAVISSAMFGTISGSAIANVVTTGSFTIPMMKGIGYRPSFAGAVEASASTGGMIMPPIMAAAAFIMAEITGIPYLRIALHALIPALLYFLAVYVSVHLEAIRAGLKGIPSEDRPRVLPVLLGRGHLVLPVFVIIYFLVEGYTPMYAAALAIGSVLVTSFFRRSTWMSPRKVLDALEKGGKEIQTVAVACACAGIIVGSVTITGLGLKLTSLVLTLSGGNLLLALVFTAVASIILGMGISATPVYIITASLLAPALVEMGVPLVAAHLFIFYFSNLSGITPPVALVSFAAAGVADSKIGETAREALKLGAAAYIVPFMFVYGPELLLIGDWVTLVTTVVTASLGVTALAAGVQGWLWGRANWLERLLYLAGAFSLIKPGWKTDLAGLVCIAIALASQRLRAKRCTGEEAHVHP